MKKLLIIALLFVGCEETLEPQDCAGVAGGTAELDNCNVCIGNNTANTGFTACTQDCAEVWGGIAVLDSCDVCDADSSNDCIADCNGDYGGTAVEDECGVCDSDSTNDGTTDNCGTCDNDSSNDGTTDNCGTCDNDSSNDCVQDGCGVWGGNNTPLTGTCDCAGTPNGDATTDNCGTCDTDSSNDCVQDCVNVWGGTSWISDCGCVSIDNSGDECDDCAGTPNGDAIEDNCETCDTDSTNNCVQDCANVWGGTAMEDDCGVCDGSNACFTAIGVPTLASNNMTVTLNELTITEKTGSYEYYISYTLENNTADQEIDEGSFKMYYQNESGGEPQYGGFNSLFPGDTKNRTYTFEELKTTLFGILSYHDDQFFADDPPSDALLWQVIIP